MAIGKAQLTRTRTMTKKLALGAIAMAMASGHAAADEVTYFLDHVITDRGDPMTGTFTWTYDAGDFENGTGTFTELNIPYTFHGLGDLIITAEISQIEFTLSGNFHDDGVDVFLVLTGPLLPHASVPLDLDPTASKYSIGGNGFIDGHFLSGSITPVLPSCPGDIADDFGTLGSDGMVSFGDFLAMLGLVGPCPGATPGCDGDIADGFGTLPPLGGADGVVDFGDFLALLGLVGPCL